ncbi:A24 family peptidase [Pseudodesulfovibrio sp. zrk46]|uniref:A24 family peptidase n=1 Tax=Pseudodesulfovibrio sp. zrk46 TaxID=2725288 RepID=UPI0014491DA7|nr:A24 family peptidase [Pseudodesulfovibrio sp. zrk46]QJB55234.1 prepilin peptidase [Pseudodesulfovibrio sp. zrk46]
MDILITIVLAAALTIATITDLRSQRIYNWLTFPLILSGLIVHTVTGGLDGLMLSGGGFGLGLGLMVVPFFMGAMGAGDVKLMAGIGAWLGTDATFIAFLATCFAGGVYALLVMFRNVDYMKAVFSNIWNSFLHILVTHKFEYAPLAEAQSLPRLCYGVAIAVGTVATMALNFTQTGSVFIR